METTTTTAPPRSELLVHQYGFSEAFLEKVKGRKTEKGKLQLLNSERAFDEMYPDSESVFQRIAQTMFLKSNNRCKCGALISKRYIRLKGRKYKCTVCKRIVAPVAYTPLRNTKLPLHETLKIAFHMYQGKHITATQIKRIYGRKYRVTLKQLRMVRRWIGLAVEKYQFNPLEPVQADELFHLIPDGLGKNVRRTRGMGSQRITPVLVLGQPGGTYRAMKIPSVSIASIRPIINDSVVKGSTIFTDGKPVYGFLNGDGGYVLHKCNHSSRPKLWSDPITGANVNAVEGANSRIKGKNIRVHRGVSEEHLQTYLDEVSWLITNGKMDSIIALDQLFEALPPIFPPKQTVN